MVEGSISVYPEGYSINDYDGRFYLSCKTGGEYATSASVIGEGCPRGTRSNSSMRALSLPLSSLRFPISLSFADNKSKRRSIIGLEVCVCPALSLPLSLVITSSQSVFILEVRFVLSISPTPNISHSMLTSGYVAKNFVITSSVIPVLLSKVPRDTPILA